MRKKKDIIWEKSTMWESIERWVVQYLKKNHPEYQQMQAQAIELVENNPALWQLIILRFQSIVEPDRKTTVSILHIDIFISCTYNDTNRTPHTSQRCVPGETFFMRRYSVKAA